MGIHAAEPGVFRQEFPLHYPDADASGFVRVTSLLNLLQIQAGDHTANRGFDYRENKANGIFWVLSRMSLRFDRWPVWPCSMVVDTWSRSTKALYALRDFRFGSGDAWVGRGTTAWVLLKDRRPQRLDPWVRIYDQVQPEPPLVDLPPALPPLDEAADAERRAEALVRRTHGVHADWEDLDMNGHVNNVNAIGWCLSQHSFEFLSQWRPLTLEANFVAEMFSGQKFQIVLKERPAAEGLKCFDYVVVREPEQTPTLRLQITFQ